MKIKTNFLLHYDGVTMTGNESYPIIGDILPDGKQARLLVCKVIFPLFANGKFLLTGSCLDKAMVAIDFIPKKLNPKIVGGKLTLVSGDKKSSYGFGWNPPLEFHAWIECDKGIIDFSLPGVILKGSTMSDDQGPFLIGREPVILAGEPEDWMIYEKVCNIVVG
ncbi:MAG: hypothetical protein WC302_03360 [Candidatus Paceibacterota bacterium]|jgi:hypothetical protein